MASETPHETAPDGAESFFKFLVILGYCVLLASMLSSVSDFDRAQKRDQAALRHLSEEINHLESEDQSRKLEAQLNDFQAQQRYMNDKFLEINRLLLQRIKLDEARIKELEQGTPAIVGFQVEPICGPKTLCPLDQTGVNANAVQHVHTAPGPYPAQP